MGASLSVQLSGIGERGCSLETCRASAVATDAAADPTWGLEGDAAAKARKATRNFLRRKAVHVEEAAFRDPAQRRRGDAPRRLAFPRRDAAAPTYLYLEEDAAAQVATELAGPTLMEDAAAKAAREATNYYLRSLSLQEDVHQDPALRRRLQHALPLGQGREHGEREALQQGL